MDLLHYIRGARRHGKTPRIFLPVLFALALLVAACSTTTTSPGATPSATPGATPTGMGLATVTFQVYFSRHPDSDSDPTAVFPVPRTVVVGNLVSPSDIPAYAVEQLIGGPTTSEKQANYYTELTAALSGPSNCGGQDFTLKLNTHASRPETGTATLQFCRATMLPGDLSGPRIKAQITRTLTQFPGIQRVVILDKSGNCFDDLSGLNQCL